MMYRAQSGAAERLQSAAQGPSRRQSSSLKPRRSISRGPSVQGSRHQPFNQPEQASPVTITTEQQQQQPHRPTTTILQRRERVRVYSEDGEDVTPKTLVHPEYSSTRRTAFDAIAALASSLTTIGGGYGGVGGGGAQTARASVATVSSFSSMYTLDEILAARAGAQPTDSLVSSARASLRGSVRNLDAALAAAGLQARDEEDDSDPPSQYHLHKIESQEQLKPEDRVTLTIRETATFFLFELASLTENAETERGEALVDENERYEKLRGGRGRKSLDQECQTPQVYTKTVACYVPRRELKNRATHVNNWVMHDDYEAERSRAERPIYNQESCTKFPETKLAGELAGESGQLAAIGEREGYEDATRVALRILAGRDYEVAQKRFAGLLVQDPCDLDLQLVYGLELLWRHDSERTRGKSVAAFRWNPANSSLLAVGYETLARFASQEDDGTPRGLVMVWCAKNPTEPDRCYEFDSAVGDLDWSRTRPNLLAVGFYDGAVRVIDVSKKQLSVAWLADDKAVPTFEPHWQVQWWPMDESEDEVANSSQRREQLYTSNQNGRVCCYPPSEEFAAREIFRCQRIEGKIAGVPRVNHCLATRVPLSRHPGALVMRRWPNKSNGVYVLATEEGCVLTCSVAQPHTQLAAAFLAHDGPVYGLEFSPFCERLMLTCGADWTARIWAEGLDEPLLKFSTRMACVHSVAWSPRNSTIFAYAVENEICIWDLRRKSYRPASVARVAPAKATLVKLEFTRSGEQLVAADDEGNVYVYGLSGMPLPPFEQTRTLVEALRQALVTKPELAKKLQKLGAPFDQS